MMSEVDTDGMLYLYMQLLKRMDSLIERVDLLEDRIKRLERK